MRNSPAWAWTSAESVFLVSAIEDWLGLELASDTAVEHPTIAQLASFVADRTRHTAVAHLMQTKTGPASLVEVLEQRAAEHPTATAFVFVAGAR